MSFLGFECVSIVRRKARLSYLFHFMQWCSLFILCCQRFYPRTLNIEENHQPGLSNWLRVLFEKKCQSNSNMALCSSMFSSESKSSEAGERDSLASLAFAWLASGPRGEETVCFRDRRALFLSHISIFIYTHIYIYLYLNIKQKIKPRK